MLRGETPAFPPKSRNERTALAQRFDEFATRKARAHALGPRTGQNLLKRGLMDVTQRDHRVLVEAARHYRAVR